MIEREQAIADPRAEFESGLIRELTLQEFVAGLSEKDQTILQMKMQGKTEEDIAAAVGYSSRSAVTKRLQRIRELYQQARKEAEEE